MMSKWVRIAGQRCLLYAVIPAILLGSLAAVVCCRRPPSPPPPSPPPAAALYFDLIACRSPFVNNYCDGPAGAVFTIAPKNVGDPARVQSGDSNGYTYVAAIPPTWFDATLTITAPGYVTLTKDVNLPTLVATNAKGIYNAFDLVPAHVDPSTIPLRELAAIRGGMWPMTLGACGNLSLGPRPGQDTNIFAPGAFNQYPKAEQDCMLKEMRRRGYTHTAVGPLVDSDGYHGIWTANDWRGGRWDGFLDMLQTMWDAGIAPIVFIHPDNWSFDQTRDQLTPLLQQPRAQRLIRIAVGPGWEPAGDNWSSCTWQLYTEWVRQVLPNALSLIHNAVKGNGAPYDAFVGRDERCDDNNENNGLAWQKIAPSLHGFLIQYGPFRTSPAANPQQAKDFAGQYLPDGLGAEARGFRWHFVNGINGWPHGSAWGPDTPIYLYYGEGTAYQRFWRGMSEADGNAWGDLAIASGADGYLDGGTVPVPVR
jgi:hypothetical protein